MTKSGWIVAARGLVFGLSLVAMGAGVAEAGWLIVDDNGDQTLISRGRLKMAPKQAEGHSMVLDLAKARLWVADARRKLYWDGNVEEYCQAVRGTMAAMEKALAEQMKNLPPEQREQMQKMLKQMTGGDDTGAAPPKVTIERTTEVETIAGLPARKYRVLNNGKLYEELWLTTDESLIRELDLGRAPDTFGRMFACMAGSGRGGVRVEATGEYREIFAQGWPLKAVYHGEGSAETKRALVTRVEQREVPEEGFAPPAGFRAAPLSEIFGQPR